MQGIAHIVMTEQILKLLFIIIRIVLALVGLALYPIVMVFAAIEMARGKRWRLCEFCGKKTKMTARGLVCTGCRRVQTKKPFLKKK